MRECAAAKALRLLAAGSVDVLEVGTDRAVARVRGDHGIYIVCDSREA